MIDRVTPSFATLRVAITGGVMVVSPRQETSSGVNGQS